MSIVQSLLSNYILKVTVIAWRTAQILKTLINTIFTKKFSAERLVGAGGMPSAHSAFVCSLVVATGNQCGFSSAEFAIAFALAVVVMYDAMGVRRAAGEQAKIINLMVDEMTKYIPSNNLPVEDLKEFLGHTPIEVIAGAILGISIALLL